LVVYYVYRLRPGKDPGAFIQFFRETIATQLRGYPPVTDVQLIPLDDPPEPGWAWTHHTFQFMEAIHVTDWPSWAEQMKTPEDQELAAKWNEWAEEETMLCLREIPGTRLQRSGPFVTHG
jgi:hypothetical protein